MSFRLCAVLAVARAVTAFAADDEEVTVHYEWRVSEWSECSDACGFGIQTRKVECMFVMRKGHHTRVTQPARDEKCGERWLGLSRQTPPKGARECFGLVPPISYCVSCPLDSDDKVLGCSECAPGFDVREDGGCTNAADQVLIDVSTRVKPTTMWQRQWRPKFALCLGALVHNITLPAVTIYSVVSADMPHALLQESMAAVTDAPGNSVARTHRRLLWAPRFLTEENSDEADLTANTAVFRAAVPVPEGVAASQFRRDLQASVLGSIEEISARGGVNPDACPPEILGLEGSAVLRADAIMAHTHGCYETIIGPLKDPEHGGFSLFAWLGILLGIVGVCWLAYIPVERTGTSRPTRRRPRLATPGAREIRLSAV